jgi:hypothetical protein
MTMTENFAELSQVSLRKPVDTENGQLPVGAIGTVVRIDPQTKSYHVKFLQPFHSDVTFEAAEMIEVAMVLAISARSADGSHSDGEPRV